MPDCDALNKAQPCGCAFKKTKSGKVVSAHDLGGWGSPMSYIAFDLGVRVFIKFSLAAQFRADCTIHGAGGLAMWCTARCSLDCPGHSYPCCFRHSYKCREFGQITCKVGENYLRKGMR